MHIRTHTDPHTIHNYKIKHKEGKVYAGSQVKGLHALRSGQAMTESVRQPSHMSTVKKQKQCLHSVHFISKSVGDLSTGDGTSMFRVGLSVSVSLI